MPEPHISFAVARLSPEGAHSSNKRSPNPEDNLQIQALVVAEPGGRTLQDTVLATLIAVSIGCMVFVIVWHRQLALLLFGGVVLATAMRPLIGLLERRLGFTRIWASVVAYSVLTILIMGSLILLVPELITQGRAFLDRLPSVYEEGRSFFLSSTNRTLRTIGNRIPATMPAITSWGILSAGGDSSNSPLSIIWQIGEGLLGVLAVGILAFYWSTHEEATIRSLVQLAPDHRQPFFQSLADELLRKLGGYIRGQLILCAAVGVLSFIAYLIIGLPYALMLALVAGVLEAVPIIGPTLGAVPAIIVALTLGPQQTALIIAAAMCVQTLENYLLVPKVMDRSVGLGAVATLLAIVACGALFGVMGAIFAIPLAAVTQTLFERFVLQADFKAQEYTARRDAAGVLHYELQDLINDIKRQQRQKETPADLWTTETFAEIETLAVALDEMVMEDVDETVPFKPLVKVQLP